MMKIAKFLFLLLVFLTLTVTIAVASNPQFDTKEADLVNYPYEVALLFNSRGVEIGRWTSHSPDYVILPNLRIFAGGTLTHNHSIIGQYGDPNLSLDDLRAAKAYGLKEMRAIANTPQGLIICRAWRDKVWPYFSQHLENEELYTSSDIFMVHLSQRLHFSYECRGSQ
jgi:hypothetical protein